jgi:hypothetical protein
MGLFDRKRRRETEPEPEKPGKLDPGAVDVIKAIDAHLDLIDAVEAHISRHFGAPAGVLRQGDPEEAIAMHVMPPTPDRPRFTVITSGMSRRPMQGAPERYARAELVLSLPPDWPLEQSALEDERNWWPLRLLQNLSHMPHATGGWLGFGHTVPHGNPPQSYAENTSLCGALLLPPVWTPAGFNTLETGDDTVQFLGVYTLHREELQYKLDADTEAFFERLRAGQVTELVDVTRPSVV